MAMIDHALAYAERGWAVMPVEPRGKVPLNNDGSRGASRSFEQITRWWTRWPKANIAVATGRASGIFVVDLDGAEGLTNWLELVAGQDAPWRTLGFRTGGGGLHLIYADITGLPNSASRLADKIDTRGDGGYIVAPPSVHPNGAGYRLSPGMDFPIRDVPPWVRRALRPPSERPKIPAGDWIPRRGGVAPVPGRRDFLADHERAVAQAPSGQRNATLNRAAYLMGRDIAAGQADEDEVVRVLTGAARAAGLGRRETEKTIASGLRAGMASGGRAPAAATPSYWPRARG